MFSYRALTSVARPPVRQRRRCLSRRRRTTYSSWLAHRPMLGAPTRRPNRSVVGRQPPRPEDRREPIRLRIAVQSPGGAISAHRRAGVRTETCPTKTNRPQSASISPLRRSTERKARCSSRAFRWAITADAVQRAIDADPERPDPDQLTFIVSGDASRITPVSTGIGAFLPEGFRILSSDGP